MSQDAKHAGVKTGAEKSPRAQAITAADASVSLDELKIKINRLNRYVLNADKQIEKYQKELDKSVNKLRNDRDFAARHLDQSASVRGEV